MSAAKAERQRLKRLEYACDQLRKGKVLDGELGLLDVLPEAKKIVTAEENRRRHPEVARTMDFVRALFPKAEVVSILKAEGPTTARWSLPDDAAP